MDPISRSTTPFCHGLAGAVITLDVETYQSLMNNPYGCGSAVGMRSNPSLAACDRSLNSDLILTC